MCELFQEGNIRKIALSMFVVPGVVGCVGQHMDQGLNDLVGKDIKVAVSKLGYPDGQKVMLGDTIYVWSTGKNVVLPMSSTSITNGNVGGMAVSGTKRRKILPPHPNSENVTIRKTSYVGCCPCPLGAADPKPLMLKEKGGVSPEGASGAIAPENCFCERVCL